MIKNMKKIALILSIIGGILIVYGIIYSLFLNKSQASPSDEDNIVFIPQYSGKYSNSERTIYLYKANRDEVYFIISDDIFGKAYLDSYDAATINGTLYKFIETSKGLTVESDNKEVNGLYKRDSDITFEEFYGLEYGDAKLFDSEYSGVYSNDSIRIWMYQSTINEVVAFINNNSKKEIVRFTINSDKTLSESNNKYAISLHDEYILFAINNNESNQIRIPFDGEIIAKDIFDLFIEYQ